MGKITRRNSSSQIPNEEGKIVKTKKQLICSIIINSLQCGHLIIGSDINNNIDNYIYIIRFYIIFILFL